MIKKAYEYVSKYINLKYFVSKIAILFFSGMISLAPVYFVGMSEVLNEDSITIESKTTDTNVVNETDELKELWLFVKKK